MLAKGQNCQWCLCWLFKWHTPEICPFDDLFKWQTFRHGGADCIQIGENIIEYNNEFKFYIATESRSQANMSYICTEQSEHCLVWLVIHDLTVKCCWNVSFFLQEPSVSAGNRGEGHSPQLHDHAGGLAGDHDQCVQEDEDMDGAHLGKKMDK